MDMLHEQHDLQTPSCRTLYQAGGDEADQKKKKKKKKKCWHDNIKKWTELPLAKTLRQRRLEKDHQNICGAPTAPQRLRAADADDDLLRQLSVGATTTT